MPEGLPDTLREQAERIQALTEEMVAGAEEEDWGRVTAAEQERRPLIPELVHAGLQAQGGEAADEWLQWLLDTNDEILEGGLIVRDELREERRENTRRVLASEAYNRNQTSE